MALTYGFYNSIEGDRVYDAIQFGRIFDGIIKDGVYGTYLKGMMVIASENPGEVIIQPGRAWFNHTWNYNDANVIFEAPAPEVLLERYDALVLEINEELSARENSYKWVTGTPSSRPERPTLTNTSTIHQYPLCYVHRYPETTMIYTRDITNAIGTSECPFATGVLEGIDLDAWINQWDDEFHNWESTTKTGFETWMLNQEQVYTTWFNNMHSQMDTDLAEFEAWFETIQGIIDEEAALHLQQEIDELRQEATSGSRIFVHTINESLFGKNVTITEAGGTVFTSRFDNTGVAEFKSVPFVGNLTISSTDGVQTATSVVNTPYYARYNFTIAFWAATVNIVGDPEMSGSTVTVRDSNEILVGTVVLDSEGTGIFTATAPDTYKFILTYGGETMEVTLSVTQETTYTVDLHAAGFKWQDWLEAGGVTGSYSSLDDVLADEVALRRLFTVHASVDYMADIDKENEDVEKIINNDFCAKWINLRDYALDTLYENTIIKGYMDVADKYFYGELTLQPQVPTMTSNTAPYGEAFASSVSSNDRQPYNAFNGSNDASNTWTPANNQAGEYIGYKFTSPTCIKRVNIKASSAQTTGLPRQIKIQASQDGTTWVDVSEVITTNTSTNADNWIELNNNTSYLYYRCLVMQSSAVTLLVMTYIQFYAWAPKGNVPIMTANNAPYGEASTNGAQASSNPAWYAFDGNENTQANLSSSAANGEVIYKFTNPISVRRFRWMQNLATAEETTLQVSYSDDGTNYTNAGNTHIYLTTDNGKPKDFDIAEFGFHLYWKVKRTRQVGGVLCNTLQFYGRELKVSVPKMTGNNAPYCEASVNGTIQNSYPPYYLFDKVVAADHNFITILNAVAGTNYYQIKMDKPIIPRLMRMFGNFDGSYLLTGRVDASKDGATYTTIKPNFEFNHTGSGAITTILIDTDEEYQYFRLYPLTWDRYCSFSEWEIFGEDYSEKEFEEGTTKKWLYDHGLELEELIKYKGSNTPQTDLPKTITDELFLTATGTNGFSNFSMIGITIDLTPYSLMRAIIGSQLKEVAAINDGAMDMGILNTDNIPSGGTYNDNGWTAKTDPIPPVSSPNSALTLDVSSIAQPKFIELSVLFYSRIGTATEWWLE